MNDEHIERIEHILPPVPENVCFTREEFVNESFCVDDFVKTHRKDGNLEQLREDLSAYLRSLRLSMIDLINEDYSDFVNLSSNLVGLDKNIDCLKQPLKVLRNEISAAEAEFSAVVKAIDEKMKQKMKIRFQKENLQRIVDISNILSTIEEMSCGLWRESVHIPLALLERFAIQMNEVNVTLKRISLNIPLLDLHLKPKASKLTQKINECLETTFLSSIVDCDVEAFNVCVKTCRLNGQIEELENLFLIRIVRPYFTEIIAEEQLERKGVHNFFENILKFLKAKCDVFVKSNLNTSNFMLKSVWKEICQSLIIRTPSLFSSGNPDIFHTNYRATQNFIQKFAFSSNLELSQLQLDNDYKDLMSKFNLTIYFHIRYQQIGSSFEKTLQEPIYYSMYNANSDSKLQPVVMLIDRIKDCWSPNRFYIDNLFHAFLKLTLQLLSRYSTWLCSFSSINFGNGSTDSDKMQQSSILFLLIIETDQMLKLVESFFQETIVESRPDYCDETELRECFSETLALIRIKGLSNIERLMKECIIKQCSELLKQVSDIPRLYRKTNREVPTKPSNYVTACTDIIKDFILSPSSKKFWKSEWTLEILENVTQAFKLQTMEVLTSVQKMEDSLRRLKKIKGGSMQQKSNSSTSDDDKIRRQLQIDVNAFSSRIENTLNVTKSSVNGLNELLNLVESTKNTS